MDISAHMWTSVSKKPVPRSPPGSTCKPSPSQGSRFGSASTHRNAVGMPALVPRESTLALPSAPLHNPPMSPLARLGEAMIDQAIASGELQPPPPGTVLDLEAYFQTPESWRAAHSMLKGHGFLPPEVEQLRRAAALEEDLANCADPAARIRLRREIEALRTAFRLAVERLRGT